MAHFIFPLSPRVLLIHKVYDQITGAVGHSGHEYGGRLFTSPSPLASVTPHDGHHQNFPSNYGTHFTLWDRLMGTPHDAPSSEAADPRATGKPQKTGMPSAAIVRPQST